MSSPGSGVNRTRADHNHGRCARLLNTIAEPQRIAGAPLRDLAPPTRRRLALIAGSMAPNDAPEHATTSARTPSRPTICAMLRRRQTATESVIPSAPRDRPPNLTERARRPAAGFVRVVHRSGRSVRPRRAADGRQRRRSVRADRHWDDVVLSRHSVLIVVALIRQIWRADVDAGGSSASAFSGP